MLRLGSGYTGGLQKPSGTEELLLKGMATTPEGLLVAARPPNPPAQSKGQEGLLGAGLWCRQPRQSGGSGLPEVALGAASCSLLPCIRTNVLLAVGLFQGSS